MFKKIQYGIALLGLSLSFICMTANANYSNCRPSTKIVKEGVMAPLCDISFTGIPSFSCATPFPQTGVFTIRNNTPVNMRLGPATLIVSDGGIAGGASITASTCGSSLAPRASCNIIVTLSNPPFNLILRIGVNSRQGQLDSSVIAPTVGCISTPSALSPFFPCALGTTSTYGVLAGTTITNTGSTTINGDLGLSPGNAVVGFPPGFVTGAQHISDAAAAQAQLDLTALYTCLAEQTCNIDIGTDDQAGETLTSAGIGAVNVFCSDSSILNSGILTLSGDPTSVFIIRAGSTLTFNPFASVNLIGGVTAANVFWQVGSSATLNSSVIFQGTIVALTSITLNTSATILGRALARNGAVTFDTNFVNVP
ncbi:MAG: DUF3494 domain-containing protein [Tatlockia sp.]|nr:DUF3494 domain-containing protein [Tatlockia sp.]